MNKAITITDVDRIAYIKNKLATIVTEHARLIERQGTMTYTKNKYEEFKSGKEQVYANLDMI